MHQRLGVSGLSEGRRFSQYLGRIKTSIVIAQGLGLRNLGIVFYCLGAFIGLSVLALSVYADFEASLFDTPQMAQKPIKSISCPILIDEDEDGIVHAKVINDSPERAQRIITGYFSEISTESIREDAYKINFNPDEIKDLYWLTSSEDADNHHLILAKVFLSASASSPAREAVCGVFVYDLPGSITGGQMVTFLHVVGIVCMLGGVYLWWAFSDPKFGNKGEVTWGVVSLIAAVLFGLLVNFLGMFALAVGLFYLSILLVGVTVPHLIFSRRGI